MRDFTAAPGTTSRSLQPPSPMADATRHETHSKHGSGAFADPRSVREPGDTFVFRAIDATA